jgi:C4-dicarboxylate transporter DctM subunit
MDIAVLVGVIIVCFALGVPIGISISLGILALLAYHPITGAAFIAQKLYSGLDSLTLLAIPCFMLAGAIMQHGGLSKQLVRFANSLVGNFTGGLGLVTILACLFFGAISGSAPATVAAIGMIMVPEMVEAGYNKVYATGLIAVAGALGIIIPPSIPMIVYGVTTYTSVGDLFIAGIIPGCVIAVCLGIMNYFVSRKRGYTGTGVPFRWKASLRSLWEAKWALFMPIIILGGIYGGIFTPTEAAMIAVVYGIIISVFVNKTINGKMLLKMADSNTSFVGGILMTFAPAAALGAIFSLMRVTESMTGFIMAFGVNRVLLLLAINVFFLFLGMIMDTSSVILIFAPLFVTAMTKLGLAPLHIGMIICVNLAIGFATPPVAINLYVASGISGIRVETVAKAAVPFVLISIAGLLVITFVPWLSTFIPSLLS